MYRALASVWLLGPQTPLLFMGQEFAASSPFTFFADHEDPLRSLVHNGRRAFLSQFRAYADPNAQAVIPDPASEATFAACKLDWNEVNEHAGALAFHRDLIRLRRTDPVLSAPDTYRLDGTTLSEHAFVLRWLTSDGRDRALIVNLDRELRFESIAEPLLAPPRGHAWCVAWSSENIEYAGHGVIPPVEQGGRGRWVIAGQCATLLSAEPEK